MSVSNIPAPVVPAVAVVKPTIGNRVANAAKAVAVLMLAFSSLAVALVATIPQDVIPTDAALWIAVAVNFLSSGAAWLATNGPKVGEAFDIFVKESDVAVGELKDQI